MIFNVIVIYLLVVCILSFKGYNLDKVYFLNCLLLIFIVGMRGYDVGSVDTLNYVNYFLGRQAFYNQSARVLEIGLPFFNEILRSVLHTGWQYLLFCACFSLLPLFYLIKKYSHNIHLSLLVLFLLGNIISVYFVCTRQVIGMAFVLWGIILYVRKCKFRIWIFALFSIVGYLVHTAALMMSVAFICVYHINIPRWTYILTCVITFFLGAFKIFGDMSIISIIFMYTGSFFDRLANYTEGILNTETNNLLYPFIRTILGCLISLFTIDKYYKNFTVKIFLIGIVIGNVFPTFVEGYRLVGIFTIFGSICITYLYNPLFKSYDVAGHFPIYFRVSSKYVVIFLIFYSCYKYISSNNELINGTRESMATLIPYQFCWEDNYSF